MRPLKIKPRHAITELALAPDGQRIGVFQAAYGFRLFDALTGDELGRDTERARVHESSPSERHVLFADRMAVRLAEVTAGRPFLRFQTGWTRTGELNRPPEAPPTSALHPATVGWVTPPEWPERPARRWLAASPALPPAWQYVNDCALTADHRFAAGQLNTPGSQHAVVDLAAEAVVAKLAFRTAQPAYEPVRTVFTPDAARVVAVTARALFVFDLPPPASLAAQPLDAVGTRAPPPVPVLLPAVTIAVTQPQPQPGVPPFALLPCGRKVLVRGEKSRVELRDLATGEVLTVWKWGLRRLHALAVAADGLTAACGGAGGEAVIWDLG